MSNKQTQVIPIVPIVTTAIGLIELIANSIAQRVGLKKMVALIHEQLLAAVQYNLIQDEKQAKAEKDISKLKKELKEMQNQINQLILDKE